MTEKEQALALIQKEGLKLGNYHYAVERCENENGVELYLTRWYEECNGCPLYEDGCDMENPPNINIYPCATMLPIGDYSSSYEFYDVEELEDYNEFTNLEIIALKMIFEDKELMKLMD